MNVKLLIKLSLTSCIGSILIFSTQVTAMIYTSEKPFIAEMYSSTPNLLRPDQVGSSEKYSLLLHLVRTPVKLSKDMQVEADLLSSWSRSPDDRKYTLNFKKDCKFSNGIVITAAYFKKSIEWHRQSNSSIHFDFSKIEKLFLVDDFTLEIVFKTPSKDFIRQLVHPEFGIYYNIDSNFELNTFNITSGPYSVNKVLKEGILLKKNDENVSKINYPEWVLWRSTGAENQLNELKRGVVDFAVPHQSFGLSEHNELIKNSNLKSFDPNMGYTFFFSLNPSSSFFDSNIKRRSFLKLISNVNLKFDEFSPIWEKAEQLYIKGGLGRPSKDELRIPWGKIAKTKTTFKANKLLVLFSNKFLFKSNYVDFLKENKLLVEVFTYNTFDEYAELIKKHKFDIVQVNNDFSSVELLENLLVTFRVSRPLVFTIDDSYKKLLVKAELEQDLDKKSQIIKKIGIKLIDDALVFPISHYKKLVYAKKIVSFNNWSSLYPDMRIYKLEVLDGN